MKATLTELHRKTADLIRPVIHSGQTVVLTAMGKDCAKVVPCPEKRGVSEDDLLRSEISDQAILDAIQESREA